MSYVFLDSMEDMQWLDEVHFKGANKYKCAVIYGNEDWPDRIELYVRNSVECKPTILLLNEEGKAYVSEQGEKPA